ncbi:hypothetical protein BDF19DRAFT_417331 [Syncephalis fuscata]|nr:hypothetical protein BDF19DRAFT_417331 [Syncephalis fuscata]
MTINTARQSRYNAGLNEWDTLSDIEVNVKTSRRTSALMAAPNSNGKQWTSHSLMVENTGECTSNNRPKSMSASSVDWRISQHGNALMIPTAIIVNRANTLESRPEGISDVIITLKPSAELEDENTSTKSSTSPRDTISSLRSNSPHNLSGESNSHHLLLRGLADAVEKMAETANSTAATIRYSRADTPIPSNTSLIADQDEILSTEEKAAIEAAVRVQTSSADRREDTFSIDDYVQCNNSTASDSPDRVRDTLRLSINSDHLLMAHYGGLINSTPSQASIFQNEIANLPVNVIAPEPINTLQSLSVSSFINNSINSGTGHSLHSWRGDLADDYHNEDVYPTI